MNLANPGFGADAEIIKAIREPMMKHLDHRFTGDRQSQQSEECKGADKDEEMNDGVTDLNQHRFTNQIRKLVQDNDRIYEFITKAWKIERGLIN